MRTNEDCAGNYAQMGKVAGPIEPQGNHQGLGIGRGDASIDRTSEPGSQSCEDDYAEGAD